MLAQQDGDVAHERNVANDAPNHLLLPIQVVLAARIELGVISIVVVALGEKI